MRKLKNYKPTKFKAKDSYYDKEYADFAVAFIESLSFAVSIMLKTVALAFAPGGVLAKSQFLRPITNGLMLSSTQCVLRLVSNPYIRMRDILFSPH